MINVLFIWLLATTNGNGLFAWLGKQLTSSKRNAIIAVAEKEERQNCVSCSREWVLGSCHASHSTACEILTNQ